MSSIPPKTASEVVIVGSSNWDICMYVPKLPVPGETVGDGRLETNIGGKGANQAVACHRAGANSYFISCVGDDAIGGQIQQQLNEIGLDTAQIETVENRASGCACIFIDRAGENCIGLTPGANADLGPALIERHREQISQVPVLLIQLEIPMETVLAAAEYASSSDTYLILNPAPARRLPEQIYAHIDLITPNRSELSILSGMNPQSEQELIRACRSLIAKGVGAVLVTLGAEGAMLVSEERSELFPAYPVSAKDTTAAGDCFNGYLAASIARCASGVGEFSDAIKTAMAAAALSVTREGAIASIPTKNEVDALAHSIN